MTLQTRATDDADQDIPRRLLFDQGATVGPLVTVAWSDESLYGYIHTDQNQPLPEGMTVSYSSNHPEVLAVGSDRIEARSAGVATLTATVRYRDREVADQIAVGVR